MVLVGTLVNGDRRGPVYVSAKTFYTAAPIPGKSGARRQYRGAPTTIQGDEAAVPRDLALLMQVAVDRDHVHADSGRATPQCKFRPGGGCDASFWRWRRVRGALGRLCRLSVIWWCRCVALFDRGRAVFFTRRDVSLFVQIGLVFAGRVARKNRHPIVRCSPWQLHREASRDGGDGRASASGSAAI